jgi:putative peptide zinc metalloprotease protein
MEADVRRAGSLLTLTTAGLLGLGLLASPATAAYGDNFVQSYATAGRTVVEQSSVMVVPNGTDTVENGNLAEAYSHDCVGCRAVAVAFQVVLVPGSPHVVTPGNLASAANERCESCTAIAFAKQYLVYSHGATAIDGDARAEVARISAQVRRVATSGASGFAMEAPLAQLFDRLVAAVENGLQDASDGPHSERARVA